MALIETLFMGTWWSIAEAGVYLFVPILALFLVFRLVHDLLWR